jgi:integrase/recombinase XerD
LEVGFLVSQQVIVQAPDSVRLLGLFVEDCRIRGLTDETIRRYKSITQQFLNFVEERNVLPVDVGKGILQDYIGARRLNGIDQKTIENEMSGISSFYGFLAFDDYIPKNPVIEVRKRYLRRYKKEGEGELESPRQLISVEQMAMLVNSVVDTRDRAILVLLAKTGIRRGELIATDVDDIDWARQAITLKPKQFRKRSNRVLFFDDETSRVLKRWMRQRESLHPDTPALFIGEKGGRLKRNGVYSMVVKYAKLVGLHDSESSDSRKHFSVHNFRHFFTTFLLRAGMRRSYVQILRGDRRRQAVDLYDHIDLELVRQEYLAFIPQLSVA